MNFNQLEDEFLSLSIKFLFVNSDIGNNSELNVLLNNLNSLDYKSQQIQNTKSILRLIESFSKIPPNNENIVLKTCCLIKQIILKQKILLPEDLSKSVVKWILSCMEITFSCEALDVLTLLLKKNSSAVEQHGEQLLTENGFLINLLGKNPTTKIKSIDNTPQEIYYSVLCCIETLLSHLDNLETHFDLDYDELNIVGKSILAFVYGLNNSFVEIDFINIITTSLNSLRFICQHNSEWTSINIGELLGITKCFVMFSLTDVVYQQPLKVMSSQQTVFEPVSSGPNKRVNGKVMKAKKTKSGKGKKVENKSNAEASNIYRRPYTEHSEPSSVFPSVMQHYRTSDSDFSDNEHNRESVSLHKQSKLRQSSLSLVAAIALTVEKRIIFGYWHSLFPFDDSIGTISLLNSVLKDSSPRCKILALQAVILLLKNSKPFLMQAENKEKIQSSFTPFSVTLGNMICSMYDKLTQSLIKEGDLTVLTQILKCLSVFIQVTPFHRLKGGIVTGFIKYVRILICHKDPTIKVAALSAMGNLISINEITPEIYELVEIPKSTIEFSRKKIDEGILKIAARSKEFEDEEEEEVDEIEEIEENVNPVELSDKQSVNMSWLLEIVFENLMTVRGAARAPFPATAVKVESLQVLSAMTTNYLLLKDHLSLISKAICNALSDSVSDVRMYASRTLDSIGNSINNYLSQDDVKQSDLEMSIAFWMEILPSVVEIIQDTENQTPLLRASLSDALANIGVHVFEKMDHQKHILLISMLTGCGYDENISVRASAIRALAVYVVFPSLREDLCYIENTTESILRIIRDPNVLIRIKTSWALGNIVDALLMNKLLLLLLLNCNIVILMIIIRFRSNGSVGSINEKVLKKILEASLEATADNDKVKVNCVRTIGNLMALLRREHFEDKSWCVLFDKSINSLHSNLLQNGVNSKVKWNICYAMGVLMRNPVVFEEICEMKWQSIVFKDLCAVIKCSPNFKVRTNACVAITAPSNRKNYEIHFMEIWSSLLMALEQSNNITDFQEYKHRDNLQDQLCFAICHFMKLMTPDDCIAMKNELFPLIDVTKQNWTRVLNRQLPEFQDLLCSSCANIKNVKENCRNVDQKNATQFLFDVFYESIENEF
ncbi:unnamed protein product [Diamesa serratosioi]